MSECIAPSGNGETIDNLPSVAKNAKLDPEEVVKADEPATTNGDVAHPPVAKPDLPPHNAHTLHIVKVLRHDPRHKSITLHAKFLPESVESDAVVILEKSSFPSDPETLLTALRHPLPDANHEATALVTMAREVNPLEWWWRPILTNDIYHKYVLLFPPTHETDTAIDADTLSKIKPQLSEMKVTVVHPATKTHLDKASPHQMHLIKETSETYRNVTRPHYLAQQLSLSWVYNILEGITEKDRVIYRHTDLDAPGNGFIVAQDYKWDGRLLEELYCLLIVEDRTLHSLRDLRGDRHLPLLRAMLREGRQSVVKKYGIEKSLLRCYFHYQPSFYHLHLHIVPTSAECLGGAVLGRGHLLQDVISRLEERSDYYEHATLFYQVADNDPLYEKFKVVEDAMDV